VSEWVSASQRADRLRTVREAKDELRTVGVDVERGDYFVIVELRVYAAAVSEDKR